mmetsp:Transcript_25155/g.82521  ORF Transcript_25155/g.82521 Transcript_25155/m.82521 type:complete len:354 (-) Transcript_25155:1058-2119(-)
MGWREGRRVRCARRWRCGRRRRVLHHHSLWPARELLVEVERRQRKDSRNVDRETVAEDSVVAPFAADDGAKVCARVRRLRNHRERVRAGYGLLLRVSRHDFDAERVEAPHLYQPRHAHEPRIIHRHVVCVHKDSDGVHQLIVERHRHQVGPPRSGRPLRCIRTGADVRRYRFEPKAVRRCDEDGHGVATVRDGSPVDVSRDDGDVGRVVDDCVAPLRNRGAPWDGGRRSSRRWRRRRALEHERKAHVVVRGARERHPLACSRVKVARLWRLVRVRQNRDAVAVKSGRDGNAAARYLHEVVPRALRSVAHVPRPVPVVCHLGRRYVKGDGAQDGCVRIRLDEHCEQAARGGAAR